MSRHIRIGDLSYESGHCYHVPILRRSYRLNHMRAASRLAQSSYVHGHVGFFDKDSAICILDDSILKRWREESRLAWARGDTFTEGATVKNNKFWFCAISKFTGTFGGCHEEGLRFLNARIVSAMAFSTGSLSIELAP